MRESLERHQVWLYFAAIVAGLTVGRLNPEYVGRGEVLLWPVIGALLYTTFTQVPLNRLADALRDRRFAAALLIGNFVIMPLVVALLLRLLPDDPALRLGVLLVLLVPCTDWFISFTHQSGGDTARAIAATPLLLVGQLLMLPLYLWFWMGDHTVEIAIGRDLLPAFVGLILVPLLMAWLTETAAAKHPPIRHITAYLGIAPIPLLAIVVFLIAASQVNLVLGNLSLLWPPLWVFVLYLCAAVLVGKLLARLFHLPATGGRTLTISLGTRNSFVVLPLALALPDAWSAAVVIIVFQSLIELLGMLVYLRGLRRWFQQ